MASVTILPALDGALSEPLLVAMAAEGATGSGLVPSRRVVLASTGRLGAFAAAGRSSHVAPPVARSVTRVSASRVRYEVAALY